MIYIFGDCELDTRLYTLTCAGKTTRPQPRVYKILTYLLEHRDRVVSKDELCEQIWPNQFIANATLESAMRLVRRAIGDSGREQRFIQTSHGYGYRFVSPVEERRGAEGQAAAHQAISAPRAPRPERGLSPFVGRQQELAMLHERLEQAESGRGCVVGLVGDPGAGKSRLLHEFRQSLRTGRVTYLEGGCLSNRRAMPYLPMLDIMRQSCEVAAGDSAETISAKVRHYLREIGMSPAERASYLLDLLGVKEGAEELTALSADVIRVRTLTTLCRLLLASCRQRPVIVVIEDAHYIDRASEDCLASLAANLAHAPILLLAAYRPVCRPAWMETSAALPVMLPPLEVRDSLSMIHAALAPEDAPAEREEAILERAAGNPLFLEELIQLITDLEPSGAKAPIPDNMRDVLRARMAQLPEGAERLLQMASVLGFAFSKSLLEAAWKGPEDLETCLLDLEQRGFCALQTRGEERIYTFKHELVQEVIYESLPPARRRPLHLMAAQALETLHAPHVEEVSDLLAYHYAKTDQVDKVIGSLTHLAETAARYGVQSEAVTALQEALARVDRLPREQQNARRLDLILRQSQALFAMGHYQETVNLLAPEQAHYDQLQDARLESRQALLLSQAYSRLEDWAATAQSARHALEAAGRCEDKAVMGQACYVLAEERYWAGCPLEGSEFSQQAVVLLEQQGESAPLGMAHLVLGLHALLLGNFARSLQAAEQTRVIGAAARDSHLLAFADWLTGWTQATCGEWEAGIAACQHSLEKAPDPLSAALALGWLGYAYLEQGDAGEAIPRLEQAAQQMQPFQRRRLEALYTTFLGEAYLLQDDLEAAQDVARQGLSIAQETTYQIGIAWAQRTLGRIAQATKAADAAEHLQAALGAFDAMQARFEAGRTHVDLAGLEHRQGNLAAATMHLTEASQVFEALQVPTYTERLQQRARDLGLPLR